MTADLHSALLEAITARRERAKAATEGPWAIDHDGEDWWLLGGGVERSAEEYGIASSFELNRHAEADIRFIAAESPDAVLRQCARDLRVLERHEPDVEGLCWHSGGVIEFWPCDEVRDLAEAYGLAAGLGVEAEGNQP